VIRHGQTSTGRQRWRYKLCQITTLNDIDSTAKHLDEFVAWEALAPTNGDQAQPQGTATEHNPKEQQPSTTPTDSEAGVPP